DTINNARSGAVSHRPSRPLRMPAPPTRPLLLRGLPARDRILRSPLALRRIDPREQIPQISGDPLGGRPSVEPTPRLRLPVIRGARVSRDVSHERTPRRKELHEPQRLRRLPPTSDVVS